MIAWVNIAACVLAFAIAVTLFIFKIDTRSLESEAARLERKIVKEREAIKVLDTEWSHLTRPERIERLARKHLGLKPVSAEQIISPSAATGSIDTKLPEADFGNGR